MNERNGILLLRCHHLVLSVNRMSSVFVQVFKHGFIFKLHLKTGLTYGFQLLYCFNAKENEVETGNLSLSNGIKIASTRNNNEFVVHYSRVKYISV